MNTTQNNFLTIGLNKSNEIQNIMDKEKFDILCLNETNLKSDIDSQTLNLPVNCNFTRKDRTTNNSRGGCGILIIKNIDYRTIDIKLDFDHHQIEASWIELKKETIYLCAFYRSSSYYPVDIFIDTLLHVCPDLIVKR